MPEFYGPDVEALEATDPEVAGYLRTEVERQRTQAAADRVARTSPRRR